MPAISSFAKFNVLAVRSGVGYFCVMFESMMQVRGAKHWQSTNEACWNWEPSDCFRWLVINGDIRRNPPWGGLRAVRMF